MSFIYFLKKCLMQFFIITTCVTVAMGVLGLTLDPFAQFGYEAFFSPVIFGFISTLPSVVTYSSRELSVREVLARDILHVILLEFLLIVFGMWTKLLHSAAEMLTFGVTVLLVYAAVTLISWLLDHREANEINKRLKLLQGRE